MSNKNYPNQTISDKKSHFSPDELAFQGWNFLTLVAANLDTPPFSDFETKIHQGVKIFMDQTESY